MAVCDLNHRLLGGGTPANAAVSLVAESDSHQNDGLALAAINGSILAIIVAASLGYLLIMLQSLHTLRARYIERANRANDLHFRIRHQSGALAPQGLSTDDLLTVLSMLATEHPAPELGLPDPSDRAERGKVLATVISEVLRRPPFLDWGGSVNLSDEAAVRAWRREFEVGVRFQVGNRNSAEGRFRVLASEADAKNKEESQGLWSEDVHMHVVDEYERFVDRAVEIDRDAAADERALDLYRKRLPPGHLVAAAIAAVFSVFIGGVAIPMVHPNISTIIDAWIPVIIYCLCLGFAAFQVWRHYKAESQ
jgi:hypothetical protein